jgi:hypothetical protein
MCIQLKQPQNIHVKCIFLHLAIDIELMIDLVQTIQSYFLGADNNSSGCFSNQLHSILFMLLCTADNSYKSIADLMFNKNRLIYDLPGLG